MTNTYTTWSENLRRERRARGLTMRELSEAAGVSQSLVALIETGYQSTPTTRGKLAAVLDIETDALFPVEGAAVS